MELGIYVNLSDINVLNKQLQQIGTLTQVQLKGETSLTHPVYLCDMDATPAQFNYVYCDDFKRYYFINDIIAVAPRMLEVHCTVDPLMSFKSELVNCVGILDRQSNVYNAYLTDREFVVDGRMQTVYREYGNKLTDQGLYLVTV